MHQSLIALSAACLLLAACGGGDDGNAAAAPAETETTEASAAPEQAENAGDQDERRVVPAPEGSLAGEPMILGDPNAPMKIIEYASTTCPACAQFHVAVLPEIKERFIDTGKLQIEFREFPTAPHNRAYAAFYLARCAATNRGVDGYVPILDTLYKRQREWAVGGEPGPVLENIAAQAGIDRDGLEECFFREEINAAVANNVRMGVEQHDIGATPSFILNDEPFDYNWQSGEFIEAIERELERLGVE